MSRAMSPSARGRSMRSRGICRRYPGGIAEVAGTADGDGREAGEAGADAGARGDADPIPATSRMPAKMSPTASAKVAVRFPMGYCGADRMPNAGMDHAGRRARAAARSRAVGVAALLLSPGSDLTYLSGYRIFSSERLTCLVLSNDGTATLVVPELESPRATVAAPDLTPVTWGETADPSAL